MIKKQTKIWKVNSDVNNLSSQIAEIAEDLKHGKVIAFPTETVYGLGANALDSEAIKKIFKAKGRPSDNPLIVHISSLDQLENLVEAVDDLSQKLINNFWPGPLTIIFRKKGDISELVTAGLPTVAIRMPNHPIALAIINAANLPIAAPSANRSGKPSPTNAEHVFLDLNGLIDGIVDGGPTGIGVESTVIDVSGNIPTVLRPGGITIEELKKVLGQVKLDPALNEENEKPISPGLKYKHYAPTGEMWIVQGLNKKKVIAKINNLVNKKKAEGKRVGVLTVEEHKPLINNADLILAFGTNENLYPMAENLYAALRIFDLEKVDFIIAEGFSEEDIALTIMNRLKKAAGGKIIHSL